MEGVNLFYWRYSKKDSHDDRLENLGDYLSKNVVSHYIPKTKKKKRKKITLYGIGSILGFRCQDATVWGSGILDKYYQTVLCLKLSSYDIRAVRGPKTRDELVKLNKSCPSVFGDPAVLMPFIFQPLLREDHKKISVIFNHANNDFEIPKDKNISIIDIITTDYQRVITRIANSKLVISSSLHGIILAEAYGVSAVLLLHENQSTFKYEDWYLSTGRKNIIVAHSIVEAMSITPMAVADLRVMQEQLINTFPSDLWV